MTIHEFVVPTTPGYHTITVPGFVRWLDVGAQGDSLVAWAQVSTWMSASDVDCVLAVVATGQKLEPEPDGRFLRSVQIGDAVCHVFDELSRDA